METHHLPASSLHIPLSEESSGDEDAVSSSAETHFKKSLAARQVSSQGCSRVFIVKVLLLVSNYVKGKLLPSIFTFRKELVKEWLDEAKVGMVLDTLHSYDTECLLLTYLFTRRMPLWRSSIYSR